MTGLCVPFSSLPKQGTETFLNLIDASRGNELSLMEQARTTIGTQRLRQDRTRIIGKRLNEGLIVILSSYLQRGIEGAFSGCKVATPLFYMFSMRYVAEFLIRAYVRRYIKNISEASQTMSYNEADVPSLQRYLLTASFSVLKDSILLYT